jgi:hypothetical protein
MDKRPLITQLRTRKSRLYSERASWETHWRDLADHVLPRTGQWNHDDRNRGDKKHRLIYNSTATGALEILVAGMMAGATSPARPWMRLASPDPDLNSYKPVEDWLSMASKQILRVFNRSNTYRALPRYYQELALYGTAAGVLLPHPDRVIHHYPLTAGQYALGANAEEEINTCYREFDMTISQMVEMFGLDKVSQACRNSYNNGRYDEWRTVIHAIEPRFDRDESKMDGVNMPFRSVYFEAGGKGSSSQANDVLLEEGYREFPVLAPRWSTSGCDIYGSSPGMTALGDIRALQSMTKRLGQAIDYKTKPPTQGPAALKGMEIDKMPGGHTEIPGDQRVTPVWQTTLELSDLQNHIVTHEQRINSRFYADLFLMLASTTKSMTATEVAERHEEKLTMLGPTLERLHNELLQPLVTQTFGHMVERGMFPPAPPELEETDLEVEFISMLAQAQQAVGAAQDDRFQAVLQGLSQTHPEAIDILDTDQYLRQYASKIGMDPQSLRSPDEVAEMRQQRAQQAAAEQQLAALQAAAPAGKAVAETQAIEQEMQDAQPETPEDSFSGYGGV